MLGVFIIILIVFRVVFELFAFFFVSLLRQGPDLSSFWDIIIIIFLSSFFLVFLENLFLFTVASFISFTYVRSNNMQISIVKCERFKK